MGKVFISYAHVNPDQDFAQQLSVVLETNGFTVFVDSKIRVGQDWVEQIDRQLHASQYFVPLLSAASIESDMVRREIAGAYKLRKAKKLTILPIRLGLEGELPYDLAAYLDLIQYVVWLPGQSFDPICRTILQAITDSTVVGLPVPAAPPKSATNPTAQYHNTGNAEPFDRSELDRVTRELAAYVGPMARMMVDHAAKKAASWQQLYETLSSEISEPKERAKFLGSRPR